MELIMNEFIKATLGIITVIGILSYTLAIIFAPFGIVWLVLAH